MSATGLNFQQKLFAVVEGLVKTTKVKDLDMDVPVQTYRLPFAVRTSVHTGNLEIKTTVNAPVFGITPRITGELEVFNHPRITDAKISALDAVVKDEKVETINCTSIGDINFSIQCETVDFFSRFSYAGRPEYITSVKSIAVSDVKTPIHSLKPVIRPLVKDNLRYFNNYTVTNKSVVLSLVSEKKQLAYWRDAVLKTRKDPKRLELIGIFYGVPRGAVENLKINFSDKCLNYNFKNSRDNSREISLEQPALFRDLDNDKSIMVKR
ncbi:MAG: hypothetical protein GY765_22815 [bacterium]|nr:hypothetical protein [bacterium]